MRQKYIVNVDDDTLSMIIRFISGLGICLWIYYTYLY